MHGFNKKQLLGLCLPMVGVPLICVNIQGCLIGLHVLFGSRNLKGLGLDGPGLVCLVNSHFLTLTIKGHQESVLRRVKFP